ncbi:ABC-2 type transport system ATP-binding protein [Gracilibacillus halotolerans]|uniref:ABC-2 type transport system ATP-binding protein n=1 Tax=Gracilibacillus halotolerans TaxID=74386 RepID=A0A841RNS4_9BACI|nr:ABC transporter ATP-binding protein [Gracilibacillus halotolerans]MBB6513527.1 ABC-2 type transport system ATP-binding protein [Gracilibacillus halotolerans]
MAVVEVRQLEKSFKGKEAVKGLDFELQRGKVIALLGPNGAGKTTTLRMLSGLLKPTKGTIRFSETNENEDIRNHIGFLPQYPSFHSWMTGKEFLIYVGQLAHLSKDEAQERANELLEKVGIANAANQRIGKYSGGMKQRLGIAQAMIHQPQLLMLDEPVSSLDPIGRREVLQLMEELKEQTTILFSTHILGDAEEICDDLLLMHNGKILESGPIKELQIKHQTSLLEIIIEENPETYIDRLKAFESIEDCKLEKGKLLVAVNDMDKARTQILQAALQEKWPLIKFELRRTTLEEMFMKVVSG